MTAVNAFTPRGHIPYLIDLAHRRMQHDLSTLVDGKPFPELRGSHFRILSMVPPEGARPSALAAIAQVTRPALGELVRHLEEHGYVEVTGDESDRRAVTVRHTARGREAAAAAEAGIVELKRNWAREIGRDRLHALIDALTSLTIDRSPQRAPQR